MDSFSTHQTFAVGGRTFRYASLPALAQRGFDLARLPFSLKILLENLLRLEDGVAVGAADIEAVARWQAAGRAREGDLVHARARPAAGLHRRARRRRPGGDARRGGAPRRRSEEDQPRAAGRAGRRPLGAGRPLRLPRRQGAQRAHRVRAQPRALPVPALGPAGLRQLRGRAAGHGHRAPGESRVPGARGDAQAQRPRALRRALGLPGHGRRHRLAHDDDQRPRRARLGRGGHRGRGGHARPAGLDARAAGRRHALLGQAARGRDGHGSRAARDRGPAAAERGRQVRRVLRPGPGEPLARRPRHDRQHGPGVRRDLRPVPGRRGHARLPALHGPSGGAGRAGRGLLEGPGPVPRAVHAAGRVLAGDRARPRQHRALAGRSQAPPGPRRARRRSSRPSRATCRSSWPARRRRPRSRASSTARPSRCATARS